MIWFSERKRLDNRYKIWLKENPKVANDSFNVISFLSNLLDEEKVNNFLDGKQINYDLNEKEQEAIRYLQEEIEEALKEIEYFKDKENIINKEEVILKQRLIDLIIKLKNSDKEWFDIADNILRATDEYGFISIGEVPKYIKGLRRENEALKNLNTVLQETLFGGNVNE